VVSFGRSSAKWEFVEQDIRETAPDGDFDLILCRNLAFTYFGATLRRRVLERLLAGLRPGGGLVIGLGERLPLGVMGVAPWMPELGIYRRPESPQLDVGFRVVCETEPAARGAEQP
jgi:chemotaxis methyl-accepting protein methylase